MPDILEYLKANGADAERKSIYVDLSALEQFGMDVRNKEDEEGKVKTYALLDRPFELPEVKLIIDSVASSKFLSEKKSDALIKKLGTVCSEHRRKELRRQVRVMGHAKSMNNSVLINMGSPVIFPAACRDALLGYTGDRGGMDVLRANRLPCDTVQASHD